VSYRCSCCTEYYWLHYSVQHTASSKTGPYLNLYLFLTLSLLLSLPLTISLSLSITLYLSLLLSLYLYLLLSHSLTLSLYYSLSLYLSIVISYSRSSRNIVSASLCLFYCAFSSFLFVSQSFRIVGHCILTVYLSKIRFC